MSETIEIQSGAEDGGWNPFVGDETMGLLQLKGFTNTDRTLNEAGNRVLDETHKIMKVCGNPHNATNNETGIVIGYVQSGKTLSFTTLTALARDNDYQVIIILGGTSTNLLDQSTKRVRKDLRIESRYGFEQKWIQLTNPSTQEDFDVISNALAQWSDSSFPNDRCKTILITVMKHGAHLNTLTNLLRGFNLAGVPTLIIDDEGDQASLNTRARWAARQGIDIEDLTENDVSMIYRRINELRGIFHHHTFIQYTATPQANLFINIMDRLSPNFIKLLTPGEEYTGGIEFFQQNPNLIREIPPNEIPNNNQPLFEPPESLLSALKIFYLGVVAGTVLESYKLPGQRNRSMLVHPSRLQGDHTTFYAWVNSIRDSWKRLLAGDDNEERAELIREFHEAYIDLQRTVADLPVFELLIDTKLTHAIQYTPVVEVNARRGATPQINWQDEYSWILVGGQSMDRGFTVEGLTVTYMPRGGGLNNVDTVQQRARFYGYKRGYLGYCRVFLSAVTIDLYNSIIQHEEDVRGRLEEFDVEDKHLDEWNREAVLDRMLNLTRANILYDDLDRERFEDWIRINAPHDTESFITSNRNSLFDFLTPKVGLFSLDAGHDNRTDEQKHLVATIPIKECLEQLLNKLKFTRDSDSATYSSLRGILKQYLERNPDEQCLVYLMSARSLTDWTRRVRRLDRNDEIQQLFQGRNPRVGEVIYPGDSEIKNEGMLSIQIHLLDLRATDFTSVPTLAIWIPDHISIDVVRQPDNRA